MRRRFGFLFCFTLILVGLEGGVPVPLPTRGTPSAVPGPSPAVAGTPSAVPVLADGVLRVRADRPGRRIALWGFDIKQTCGAWKPRRCRKWLPVRRLNTQPRYVRAVFGSGHMNMIRIPIRADRRGVRRNGVVRRSYYRPFVKATKKAMRARHGQGLTVFASRSTVKGCPLAAENRPVRCPDYAPALKSKGNVVPAKYARLLASYVRYFRRNGIRIDVLGMENEPANNEGRLVKDGKYARVAVGLKRRLGKNRPKLAMSDTGNPRPKWFRTEGKRAGSRWNKLTVASTHYSSRKRKKTRRRLFKLARIAGGRSLPDNRKRLQPWNTEFHWNDIRNKDRWEDAREALFSTFDQTDFGYRGLVWWAYSPTKKARLQRAVVDSTARAARLPVQGWNSKPRRGRVTMRAFRRGQQVFLWVVNDTGRARNKQALQVEGESVRGRPAYTLWDRGRNGRLVRGTGRAARLLFGPPRMSFPAHSITLVRVQVR